MTTSDQKQPPKPVASAFRTSGTCRLSPLPITWIAASATRSIAVAPMQFVEITPPEGLIGSFPPMCVFPSPTNFAPSPGPQNPMSSIHFRPAHV